MYSEVAMSGTEGRQSSPAVILQEAWSYLRVSIRAPTRLPSWDAIVLTAASPAQANLYHRQLLSAKQNGRIARSTTVLAVPDPSGKRIGSGGATLGALRGLAGYLTGASAAGDQDPLQPAQERQRQGACQQAEAGARQLARLKVLLVHAGGDSKRVPWANPMGKPFIPFPLLADEDPDGPAPTLFDHILAVSAPAVARFGKHGGLLIMTGDVLPCFDSSAMGMPEDGALVVTVPCPLDMASRHGVILAEAEDGASQDPQSPLAGVVEGGGDRTSTPETTRRGAGPRSVRPSVVRDLLQKPSVAEMIQSDAVVTSGAALLDTGIFAVRGKAWRDLIGLALDEADPVEELLASGEEMSLYEELAGAWVPNRHLWVAGRPLGLRLITALGSQRLYHHRADELTFLHFGTTGEILDHVGMAHQGQMARRHLSITASAADGLVAPSAVLVRLAREVLQNVVRRYVQRDTRLISSIQQLTALADAGRRCLAMAKIDELGPILRRTWQLHQELDPYCSNPEVDALFGRLEHLSLGHKLMGAGGGGFGVVLAKSKAAARELRTILSEMGDPIRVYEWTLWEG